jgi:hypothetical protein
VAMKCDGNACRIEEYIPINFADEEVYALIAKWDAFDRSRGDETSGGVNASDDVTAKDVYLGKYDPLRRMTNPAPPQKFKRSPSVRTEIRRSLPFGSTHSP